MTQINSINSEEKLPSDQKEDVPELYGNSDRYLYKQNIERAKGNALDQALGTKEQYAPSNPNDYIYSRTIEFPQPSIAGIGVVTSAGAIDTSRFFFPSKWVPSKTGTGVYLVTHKIGDAKYSVLISPLASTAFTANISAFGADTFQVSTFNAAGTAADCPFTFTVWIIP